MPEPILISAEDAREYSEAHAQIGTGWWRLIAWGFRQRIPEALGMGRREWAVAYHGYMRLPVEERREAVAELSGDGLNNSEIADALGVDESTVRADKRSGNPEPDSQDGPELQADALEPDDGSGNPEPEPEPELAPGPEPEPEPEPETAQPKGAHVGKNTGDNEWYTPAKFIKAAVAVMGGIDLDPASTPEANEVVGAACIWTAEDDGLTKQWSGRVWMNPPYAQPLVDRFCTRLAREFRDGDVTQACVLVNNATETGWFQEVLVQASAVCFPRGRIKFWHPEKEATPLQGQAIIYLGPNVSAFKSEFLRFGPVGAF